MDHEQSGAPVRIAMWPGASAGNNPFVDQYATGLRRAGIDVLDVRNPRQLQQSDPADVFHIHWPEQVFWSGGSAAKQCARIILVLAALSRARRNKTKIVWMVHNLKPHDMPVGQRIMWFFYGRMLARLTDAMMTLSPRTIAVVKDKIGGLRATPAISVNHPVSPVAEPTFPREAMRTKLDIAPLGRVFIFFGLLRPYKNIEALIAAFHHLPEGDNRLIIVGKPHTASYLKQLQALIGSNANITLAARDVSESELSSYIAASDFVVLPFEDYLHSATIVHALCSGRPVITPPTPYAMGLADRVGNEWLQTYRGPLSSQHLQNAISPQADVDMSFASVERVGAAAADFYRGLVARRQTA